MSKYNLSLDTKYWQCEDGCCDVYNTKLAVNGKEVDYYSDLSMDNFEALDRFMEVLNSEPKDFHLVYSVKLDENEFFQDVILLNDKEITASLWACSMFEDILNSLNIEYKVTSFELDWDIWHSEKRIVLEIQDCLIIK